MISVMICIETSLCQSWQGSVWQNSKHLIAHSFPALLTWKQQQWFSSDHYKEAEKTAFPVRTHNNRELTGRARGLHDWHFKVKTSFWIVYAHPCLGCWSRGVQSCLSSLLLRLDCLSFMQKHLLGNWLILSKALPPWNTQNFWSLEFHALFVLGNFLQQSPTKGLLALRGFRTLPGAGSGFIGCAAEGSASNQQGLNFCTPSVPAPAGKELTVLHCEAAEVCREENGSEDIFSVVSAEIGGEWVWNKV